MSIENLIELPELMRLLGYEDLRSVRKWCDKNNVPILKLGSKVYTLSQYLTQYIDNQLVIFVKSNKAAFRDVKNESETGTKYKPDNEVINNYLSKYETNNKFKTPKKR